MNGMAGDKVLKPMPADSLVYTGHYIDDELVKNIKQDNKRRLARKADGKPMRFLLTIGGAGAQKEIFAAIINELLPEIRNNKVALYVNIGDYLNVWEDLRRLAPDMYLYTKTHINDWEETKQFCKDAIKGDVEGIHLFCHSNIFEAVYATNLLMRSCDVLVTKPSELAFYPVPKLFIKRIGGHEQWGAIHSAEMGDGTLECQDIPHTLQMARLFLEDDVTLKNMCDAIDLNKKMGVYDGAYNAVKIAMALKNGGETA
jgi:hypothetical protein